MAKTENAFSEFFNSFSPATGRRVGVAGGHDEVVVSHAASVRRHDLRLRDVDRRRDDELAVDEVIGVVDDGLVGDRRLHRRPYRRPWNLKVFLPTRKPIHKSTNQTRIILIAKQSDNDILVDEDDVGVVLEVLGNDGARNSPTDDHNALP